MLVVNSCQRDVVDSPHLLSWHLRTAGKRKELSLSYSHDLLLSVIVFFFIIIIYLVNMYTYTLHTYIYLYMYLYLYLQCVLFSNICTFVSWHFVIAINVHRPSIQRKPASEPAPNTRSGGVHSSLNSLFPWPAPPWPPACANTCYTLYYFRLALLLGPFGRDACAKYNEAR